MKLRVLITGSRGQLGSKLTQALSLDARFEAHPTDRQTLDVTNARSVLEAARATRPSWIVNCTAYNDVERAEVEPEKALQLNDEAVGNLADAAADVGASVLHVSTDYVFSGDFGVEKPRPYDENDAPAPLSKYGASKLAGERRLLGHGVGAAVLRTSWLYGGPGRNFLHTIVRVGREAAASGRPVRVVHDQVGTPTDAWSLAAAVQRVLLEEPRGLFHASCQGESTWYDFTREIYRRARLEVAVEPIRRADYPGKAKRPAYSVLDNRRLRELGADVFPPWAEGLERAWRFIEPTLEPAG